MADEGANPVPATPEPTRPGAPLAADTPPEALQFQKPASTRSQTAPPRLPKDPPSSGRLTSDGRRVRGARRSTRRDTPSGRQTAARDSSSPRQMLANLARNKDGEGAEDFLRRLADAKAPLLTAVSSEQIYSGIKEAFKVAIDAEAVGVLKVVDRKLRLKAQEGFSIEQLRTAGGRIGEDILGKLAQRGGNYVAPNPQRARDKGQPLLAVRVKSEESTVVIAVYSIRNNRPFDKHTGLLLDELVKFIGHILEHADREDMLQKELSALRDLSSLSVAGNSLEVVLDKGLMWTKKIVHSERRVVILEDRLDNTQLVARAIRGTGPAPCARAVIPRHGSLAGEVLATGVAASFRQLSDVPHLSEAEPYLDGPLLALPLSANDKRIGVMVMCRARQQSPFRDMGRRRLEPVATQMALAIQAAQQYELAVERGEELMAIVRSITDGVVVATRDGQLILANPAARLLLGLSEDGPLDRADESRMIEEVIGSPDLAADEEKELVPSSNPGHILKVKLAPFIGKDGQPRGVVAALDDITREKELARAKDAFLSSVSHELRTPLTSIVSSVAVLKRYAKKGGDQVIEKFARIIEESSDRLNTIVEECLDLANLEQGLATWNFELGSIAAVLDRCLADHCRAIEERQIEVDSQIEQESTETAFDHNKLEKTVGHLLELALENTSPGGKIQIGAAASASGLSISVWVAEFERSLGPTEIRRAFEAFQQVDPDDLCKTTTGLGIRLPICKTIVERHGGSIRLEGGEAGVRYVFDLPIQSVEAAQAFKRPTSMARMKSHSGALPKPASANLPSPAGPQDATIPGENADLT